MYRWIVGVDEAGRGPLAGPVVVGAAVVPKDFDWAFLPGVGDSKMLTPGAREVVFNLAKELRRQGRCDFCVSMVSAPVIDRIGITRAVSLATARALGRLALDNRRTFVKLDGLLRAPDTFVYQQTTVRGDATEKEIGLASIVAKVTRDRYMVRLSRRSGFVPYQFHLHKGYGTSVHRAAILKWGLSGIHRRSFCRGL